MEKTLENLINNYDSLIPYYFEKKLEEKITNDDLKIFLEKIIEEKKIDENLIKKIDFLLNQIKDPELYLISLKKIIKKNFEENIDIFSIIRKMTNSIKNNYNFSFEIFEIIFEEKKKKINKNLIFRFLNSEIKKILKLKTFEIEKIINFEKKYPQIENEKNWKKLKFDSEILEMNFNIVKDKLKNYSSQIYEIINKYKEDCFFLYNLEKFIINKKIKKNFIDFFIHSIIGSKIDVFNKLNFLIRNFDFLNFNQIKKMVHFSVNYEEKNEIVFYLIFYFLKKKKNYLSVPEKKDYILLLIDILLNFSKIDENQISNKKENLNLGNNIKNEITQNYFQKKKQKFFLLYIFLKTYLRKDLFINDYIKNLSFQLANKFSFFKNFEFIDYFFEISVKYSLEDEKSWIYYFFFILYNPFYINKKKKLESIINRFTNFCHLEIEKKNYFLKLMGFYFGDNISFGNEKYFGFFQKNKNNIFEDENNEKNKKNNKINNKIVKKKNENEFLKKKNKINFLKKNTEMKSFKKKTINNSEEEISENFSPNLQEEKKKSKNKLTFFKKKINYLPEKKILLKNEFQKIEKDNLLKKKEYQEKNEEMILENFLKKKNQRKIVYLGNLPFEITYKDLNSLQKNDLKFSNLRIRVKKKKKFAYVDFFDENKALRFVEENNGKNFFGKIINVSISPK